MHVFMMLFAVHGQPLLGAAKTVPPPPGFGKAELLPTPPFAEWSDAPETPSTLSKVVSKTTTTKPSPAETPVYLPCGGLVPNPLLCPSGYKCVDDPRVPGCGLACDMPGVCVENIMCGGIMGRLCPAGKTCVYQSNCDPYNGGRDCGGVCE